MAKQTLEHYDSIEHHKSYARGLFEVNDTTAVNRATMAQPREKWTRGSFKNRNEAQLGTSDPS